MSYGANTYSNISAFVNTIYDGAMLVVRENVLAPSIVQVFSDRQGLAVRVGSQYGTATINTIGESDDLASQVFSPSTTGTISPAEYGGQFLLTDSRLETDPFSVRADAAQELGDAMVENIDTKVFGNLSSLTGGSVGTSGSAISWTYVFNGFALLRGLKMTPPYVCVMHPYQWNILARAASVAGTATNASEQLKQRVNSNYMASVIGNDYLIVQTSLVQVVSTDAYAGFWSLGRPPIALDIRRAPRLEPERDASRRAWELNMSGVFGHGAWKPARGVYGVFALTTPA